MKLEKLEIYKKQLLLTLSGVFVLLSNTAMAMEAHSQFQDTYEATIEHRRTVGASKATSFEMGIDTAKEKTAESSRSNATGTDSSFGGSFLVFDFHTNHKNERTSANATASKKSVAGSMKASSKVEAQMKGEAGYIHTFRGDTGNTSSIDNGLIVAARLEQISSASMKMDEEAAWKLTDKQMMTQNVKEARTGIVASREIHSIFDENTGSSGKSRSKKSIF